MKLIFKPFDYLSDLISFVNLKQISKENIQSICKRSDDWVLIYWE